LNRITTDLLDFDHIGDIPRRKVKELKITREDREYFSGAKKKLLFKQRNRSNEIDEKPSIDDPLNK
jgi:hypothetical protein